MSNSLYDISIKSYLQTLGGIAQVMEKGAAHAANEGINLDEFIDQRMREDMLPFSFQVISVWHHSLGAIKGLHAGEFRPPPTLEDLSYAKLQGLVAEAASELGAMSEDEVNAMAGKDLVFKLSGMELPFKAEDFILSFSLPNFYFHSTTTYAMLRMMGTPLGKMDFLGAVRVNQ